MRLKHIDGLKLIFCFAVVMSHYYVVLGQCDVEQCFRMIPNVVYNYGYLGVEFFFIVSGFFIAYTYQERLAKKEIKVISFLKKRLFSLYPMYVVSNFVCMIITILDSGFYRSELTRSTVNIYNIICVLTMNSIGTFQNDNLNFNSSLWFVNELFICYVIYSIIASYTKSKNQYRLFIYLMLIVGLMCITYSWGIPFLYYENGRAYVGFFAGCLLYDFQKHANKGFMAKIAFVGCVFMVLVTGICIITKSAAILGNLDLTMEILGFPLLIVAVNNLKVLRMVFDNKIINALSSISVSVYFIHYAVLLAIKFIDKKMNLCLNYSSGKIFFVVMMLILGAAFSFKILVADKFTNYIKMKNIMSDNN